MALNNCVMQDVDDTIQNITAASQNLDSRDFRQIYGELQRNIKNTAAYLNVAASKMFYKGSSARLEKLSKKFGKAFNKLILSMVELIGGTKETAARTSMVFSLQNVCMLSNALLIAAQAVADHPSVPNSKSQLAAASRSVRKTLNNLMIVSTWGTPLQREYDNAIQQGDMFNLQHVTIRDVEDFFFSDECLEKGLSASQIIRVVQNMNNGINEVQDIQRAEEKTRRCGII